LDFDRELEIATGELGLLPSQFWDMTYAEFILCLEGCRKREIKKTNDSIANAWHTAYLLRVDQFPDLKDILLNEDNIKQEKHIQTDEEMMMKCRFLNAALGGDVVYIEG
jgi:hypothetical protein